MMPDLPIPVRMTRPRQRRSRSTARSNRSSRRSTSARIAAASVCSTFRARPRSAMSPGRYARLFDDSIDGQEPLEQWLERIQSQRVLRVALRHAGFVVDFEEDAVDACADARRGKRLDILRLPRRDTITAA